VLLTRLAVDLSVQGKGLGRALLYKAAEKAILASELVAARLFVVDALNDNAADFYRRFGFSSAPTGSLRMYISLHRLKGHLSKS